MKTKKCTNPNCGKEDLPAYSVFCSDCGNRLENTVVSYSYFLDLSKEKLKDKDYYGAILDLNKAEGICSEDYEIYYTRGIVRIELKEFFLALKDFIKALKLNSNCIDIYVQKAITECRLGLYSEAKYDYNQAKKIKKEDEMYKYIEVELFNEGK